MDICVTLKPSQDTEPAYSVAMKLVSDYRYIGLVYKPETLLKDGSGSVETASKNFVTYLKEGYKELRSYHIIYNDPLIQYGYNPEEEYLLIGLNEAENLLCLDAKDALRWMQDNKAQLSEPRYVWLEEEDGTARVVWKETDVAGWKNREQY
jgi:hypothetical protein